MWQEVVVSRPHFVLTGAYVCMWGRLGGEGQGNSCWYRYPESQVSKHWFCNAEDIRLHLECIGVSYYIYDAREFHVVIRRWCYQSPWAACASWFPGHHPTAEVFVPTQLTLASTPCPVVVHVPVVAGLGANFVAPGQTEILAKWSLRILERESAPIGLICSSKHSTQKTVSWTLTVCRVQYYAKCPRRRNRNE